MGAPPSLLSPTCGGSGEVETRCVGQCTEQAAPAEAEHVHSRHQRMAAASRGSCMGRPGGTVRSVPSLPSSPPITRGLGAQRRPSRGMPKATSGTNTPPYTWKDEQGGGKRVAGRARLRRTVRQHDQAWDACASLSARLGGARASAALHGVRQKRGRPWVVPSPHHVGHVRAARQRHGAVVLGQQAATRQTEFEHGFGAKQQVAAPPVPMRRCRPKAS